MDGLCGNVSFWDTEFTWTNNSWPQFTDCFQSTILQWIPCGWLWLSIPIYTYYLAKSEASPQAIKCLFGTKMFCSLVLLLVFLVDLIEAVERSDAQTFPAEVQASLIWIVTIILHAGVVLLERSRSVIRSPVLFLFWVLAGLSTLILFYTSIMTEMYETDSGTFVILCIKYGVVLSLLFLNCFTAYDKEKTASHNPEVSASMLSWISYSWLDRLMLKGFKSPLKSEDVYEIHPRDECHRAVNKYLHSWETEKQRRMRKSARKRKFDRAHDNIIDATEKTSLLSKVQSSRKQNSDQPSINDGKTNSAVADNWRISYGGTSNSITHLEDQVPATTVRVPYFKTLLKCYWVQALQCQWGMVMYVAMNLFTPIVLGWLINFTKDPSERTWHGYIYTLVFIVTKMLYTSFGVVSKYLTNCLAVRARSATIATVFRKALSMSSEARKESTVGEIVNLMSVDSTHIEMMINYSYWMWMSVAFCILGTYLIYTVIGIAMFAGLGFVFLVFVMNFWVMNTMRKLQDQIMVVKDERVKVINEVLNGMKVIKLYGWEPMFIEKINEIRERELGILIKCALLDGFESFAWLAAMFWMMFFMLLTFVLVDDDHYLDANKAFLTMNYIDVLKLGINVLPIVVKDWIKAANSVMRLNKFLNSDDLNAENLLRDTTERLPVRMMNADFKWEKDGPLILQNINLSVEPGQLVAIVGTVGAGKSSVLSAMLGEMHKPRGYANLNSSVAYVPQQAWIQNDSVKDNILFGQTANEDFYRQVIDACALQSDLDIMPAGDRTEIGEKGINLSGGQKQRISLARAVYSQADIYLMDDPLSAVDSHVGKHIFDHVLSKDGLLKTKTRVLVTHGIHWLPFVDHIFVMNNGQISESGSYEDLISHNGAFAQFLAQYLVKRKKSEVDDSVDEDEDEDEEEKEIKADILRRLKSVTSDSDSVFLADAPALVRMLSTDDEHSPQKPTGRRHSQASPRRKTHSTMSQDLSHKSGTLEHKHFGLSIEGDKILDQSRLISEEDMEGGKVKWSVYLELMKGMGFRSAIIILFFVVCYHASYNYTNVWVADWNDDAKLSNFTFMPRNSTAREDRNTYYIAIFAVLGIAQTLFVIGYSVVLQIRHVAASRKLHSELLDCIMRAPMSFFDTTPIGRILNRFSQDIETLDNDIFLEAEIALDNALRCVATVIIISYTMPIFLAVVVPVIIVLYFVQQFYIRTSCQLRRIASNNRSPVFAHFSETLSGVSVIRAYQAQDRFITDSQNKIDNFQKAVVASRAVNKWLEARLDVLSYVVVAAAGIFAVLSRDELSPGLVALAVSYALRVSTEMNVFTILFGELETHIVSVERIREYSVIKSEAAWVSFTDSETVDEHWPSEGEVQFVNYCTRYREGLDLVLRNVNCTINGGEKVGIVGRTGAGKSSMVLSLFRLIEAASGKIIIDGVDISQIGLHVLRRKLTILPQDPVLFAGNMRMNLDPFGEKSDSELWTALEHSHLKSFVESLPQKLDHEVGEGGENLSMGQRQLVCLARTLLRKTKILILDEATAAVDMETDDLIQKTIREEFSGCTILTIAHRLNTIMDYDRILVLDRGHVAEFDSPKSLLSKPSSIFYSMASQAGLIRDEHVAS